MAERKQCIGIFTASLDDAYQSTIWHAIEQSAEEKGFGSISFLGSRLGSPIASEASSNLAYHLANKRNIDGLIIISSCLETFLTSVDLKAFFASWADLPRVSIGMRIPGMSDVSVDESKALTQVMEHLIDEHKHTHFALIGGPISHDEAISRLNTCLTILKERNIPIDQRLIVSGTFTQDSGIRAVELLCETGLFFDALVCLNDQMAQGALKELNRRGIRVPEDVALIGFDGIEASLYTLPPLTTVGQPMRELGTAAVNILERLMKGGKEEHLTLECTAIFRESCGCKPRFRYTPDLQEIPQYASLAEKKAIDELINLIKANDYDGLIICLNHAIDTTGAERGSLPRWYEYLSFIEHQCREYNLADNQAITNLMGAAKAFTAEKIERHQATKRISAESSFETLRRVSAILAGAFELSDMFANLKKVLKMFGIDRGYLVVFNKDKNKTKLLMDIEKEAETEASLPQKFNRTNLLPSSVGHFWKQRQWILMPLVYNSEPLGYLIVPIGIEIPALYDILQEQISSNLKGTLLLEQIRSHEKTLSQQVTIRTKDLISTNKELSAEIKRRSELEKEVLEISNQTIERIGQDLHDDLCQHLLGISLLVSSVKKIAIDHQYITVDTLEKISALLSEAITKIKTISRGMLPFEMEPHTFLQRIEALVGDTLRISHVNVHINADPDFEIEDANAALHIFHIIQEALNNAIKHSHAQSIEISLIHEIASDGTIYKVASVVDDGIGLPKQIREGGLGLRIMHNRASMAQAQLLIDSSKKGTAVRVCIGRQDNGTKN
ncbi:substrate-binding domain-containing protein [uncultured Sphaerochaeta sp.]|uniref:substrate-binding domain-containing protein n=1 Tax=uncultured Sphaerochaeta sp. TaxID=886478 RepID=UPI002A0A1E7B|nr:substrate-binding domain-containing protein [uncultured Sphaerochaeta sp.]